jgi:uncharacterized protein YecE (DUF72 family)
MWPEFPAEGSHLERYAQRFDAVEIDTSFYRPHRRETYERWAASTPAGFRFAVKLPQAVTHECRLIDAMPAFEEFAEQVEGLGDKLGALVVQLPPSLAFDAEVMRRFFAALRRRHSGAVVLEPRHRSWFTPQVDELLAASKWPACSRTRCCSTKLLLPAAGRALSICGCTARRGAIGRPTTTSCWCGSRSGCSWRWKRARNAGACSTTRRAARPWATR